MTFIFMQLIYRLLIITHRMQARVCFLSADKTKELLCEGFCYVHVSFLQEHLVRELRTCQASLWAKTNFCFMFQERRKRRNKF